MNPTIVYWCEQCSIATTVEGICGGCKKPLESIGWFIDVEH